MTGVPRLLTPEALPSVVLRLAKIQTLCRFDRPGERQAETLAHSLADLEGSFRRVIDVLLPKVIDSNTTTDQLNDVLLDIGEELRHVLYHIRDPEFFGYLFDEESSE